MGFERFFEIIFECIGLFIPWAIISDFERGVVLRFGKFHRELGPGFHWRLPFGIEQVLHDNVVPRTLNLKAQSLTTADGKPVVISAVVTAQIKDIRKALLEVETVDNVLEDSCYGAIGLLVSMNSWTDIVSEGFTEVLTKACRKRAFKYGMEILAVQLSDAAPVRALRLYN